MMVAATTARTSGVKSCIWRLPTMLSTRILVDAGSTRPAPLLITVRSSPNASSLRRGRTSSWSSGATLRNCSLVFFFGLEGATTLPSFQSSGPAGDALLAGQAGPKAFRQLCRARDRQHVKAGGAPAGDSGRRIFHDQGGAGAQQAGGQQIGLRRGLVPLDGAAIDQRAEEPAQIADLQRRLDLGARARTHYGQLIFPVQPLQQSGQGGGKHRIPHAPPEKLFLRGVLGPERFPIERRLVFRGDQPEHLAVVHAHVARAVLFPGEMHAEGRQHLGPARGVQRFAIEQHAVEVEQNGVVAGHSARNAQRSTPSGLCYCTDSEAPCQPKQNCKPNSNASAPKTKRSNGRAAKWR